MNSSTSDNLYKDGHGHGASHENQAEGSTLTNINETSVLVDNTTIDSKRDRASISTVW